MTFFTKKFLSIQPNFRMTFFVTAQTAFHHCTFRFVTAHCVHHCTLKQALNKDDKINSRTMISMNVYSIEGVVTISAFQQTTSLSRKLRYSITRLHTHTYLNARTRKPTHTPTHTHAHAH